MLLCCWRMLRLCHRGVGGMNHLNINNHLIMSNKSINPADGRYNGYRVLTFLIPLNAPTSVLGRQRNLKLRHLLRWFAYLYSHSGFHYYRMSPKSDARLRYGALCVCCKRFCKADAVAEQLAVQELVRRLRAENLCSSLYILDDNGVGEASLITGISVSGKAGALVVNASELNGEVMFGGTHVPYFARRGLRNMADRPVEAYSAVLRYYEELFGR